MQLIHFVQKKRYYLTFQDFPSSKIYFHVFKIVKVAKEGKGKQQIKLETTEISYYNEEQLFKTCLLLKILCSNKIYKEKNLSLYMKREETVIFSFE